MRVKKISYKIPEPPVAIYRQAEDFLYKASQASAWLDAIGKLDPHLVVKKIKQDFGDKDLWWTNVIGNAMHEVYDQGTHLAAVA